MYLLFSLLWLTICPLACPIYAQERLPDYPQPLGVSAPFAGFVDGKLLVAGGCNFPDTPAADGGKKVFYDTVYALDTVVATADGWQVLSRLPQAVAYGASATTPYGLACVGGLTAQGPVADAYLLQADGRIVPLPALPIPIDNGGAALIGKRLYVTGGNQPDGGKTLYVLDLDAPVSWKRLADYPGEQRVQPVVLAAPDALYLIGGYAFDASQQLCTLATDILKYDPATDTWKRMVGLVPEKDGTPRCLVGGSGVYRDGCLFLTGGVNYDIFRRAMEGRAPADYMRKTPAWYRFNDDVLVYDLRCHTWQVIPDVPGMARAGGILLEQDGTLYMICGEVKPGVRTAQISCFHL